MGWLSQGVLTVAKIGEEVLRIALKDILTRQEKIEKYIDKSLTEEQIISLIHEQTEMINSTTSLFNRMY